MLKVENYLVLPAALLPGLVVDTFSIFLSIFYITKRTIEIRETEEKSSITEETPNGVILKILQIRGLKDQKNTPPPPGPSEIPLFPGPPLNLKTGPKSQKAWWRNRPKKHGWETSYGADPQNTTFYPPRPVFPEELTVDHGNGGEGRQIPSK